MDGDNAIIEVPHTALSSETLRALIEEFITREGTDYGTIIYTLDQKVDPVMHQLERGDVILIYDPESESCNLVSKKKMV